MKETWRWYGHEDGVSLSDVRQTGASGIVTALYDIAPGAVWRATDIAARKKQIEAAGLTWEVVESLPVSEAILSAGPENEAHTANWVTSLEHLAEQGINVICYNFMPILDWTRTDLSYHRPSGARALRFDLVEFATFDIHILAREGARNDYGDDIVAAAAQLATSLSADEREALSQTILAGLPGTVEHWTLDSFRDRLGDYKNLDKHQMRANLTQFLEVVVPHAERLGLLLCCHPDDPPWPIFGLPRVMSTEADYQWLVDAVPSPPMALHFAPVVLAHALTTTYPA